MTTTNSGEVNTEKNAADGGAKLGIYVHVPFCVKKCKYCDFLSFENTSAIEHKVYVKALLKELEAYAEVYGNNYTVNSIFIGGGTPSAILPSMIEDIVKSIKCLFNTDDNSEVTIEANPKTLSELKLDSYLACGINRISIGAQSFDEYMLRVLGRVHISDDISKSFIMARDAGFKDINLDLILGIPGQTTDIWKDTLGKALSLKPEHLSFYGLQIEEGTRFHEMLEAGELEPVPDERDREMYHFAVGELKSAGYEHYEISNAAAGGHECKHNIKYWSMNEYLGIGLGAHSYVGGCRFGNIRDFEKYINVNLETARNGERRCALLDRRHENSVSDDISEYMFTGLRMMKGIDFSGFEKKFGKTVREVYSKEWPAVEKYIAGGFLTADRGGIRLSEKGIDISNKIMSEFMILNT